MLFTDSGSGSQTALPSSYAFFVSIPLTRKTYTHSCPHRSKTSPPKAPPRELRYRLGQSRSTNGRVQELSRHARLARTTPLSS
ncbi:hypothetical protein BDV98DRAFT_566265 [Pterulicium gracile]|uniref:Uncharacterized protein n=1 Tax=Pterulicium gracile TaxID=1884261 RepID=A0A5C3QL02_9AGAR|nr:hypothetical protein BDV98DRAFT_566265 [Pterula gracilis]